MTPLYMAEIWNWIPFTIMRRPWTGHELEEDPDTGELAPTGPEVTSSVKESDRFLLYEVQVTDLISRIAKHYGVTVSQICRDNELAEQLTRREGAVLFIRNPETDEPYTYQIPEDKLERFLLESLLNGEDPRCASFGEPSEHLHWKLLHESGGCRDGGT